MSADLLIAHLAAPVGTKTNFGAGHTVLDTITEPTAFSFDEFDLDDLLDDFDPDVHLDTDGAGTLNALQTAGHTLIDRLEEALDDRYVAAIEVAGYLVHMTGGLSWGDAPTDQFDVLNKTYGLPTSVLVAMGFVPDARQPAARSNGSRGRVTDTDVVDAIALGLGTQSEWNGCDCLEWIAAAVGKVRRHPGGGESSSSYLGLWSEDHEFDPLSDSFLAQYVDDEATTTDDDTGD